MNKGYIKIALAFLSVAGCMQNITFASEHALSTNSLNTESKQQLFIDPEEAKQAADVMADTLDIAQKHAQHSEDYKLYSKNGDAATLYFKRINETDIGKLDLIIPNPDCYDDIISLLMDPNGPKKIYNTFVDGHVSRIYNPNLLIMRRQYKSTIVGSQRYCYALVNKTELSDSETAIVMVSSDTNDRDSEQYETHINPIVESANLFKPDIDPLEDIRNANVPKMHINLAAFFIKKEADCVKVTIISSVNYNAPSYISQYAIRRIASRNFLQAAKLGDIFKKE
ncbi:fam-a protein [Plasmodium vinckei brucechwatti]|uniref:Fam-a protein n=1 Tax=Plasmodium vinckei brucechwatti TaxID=119398 RepID=A0A6V7SNJ1_PLAVN|nr:fam-a protein [Plasmodium vinckei brucechwatti]